MKTVFFLESTCACVLGPWSRAFLSLASRVSVLGKAAVADPENFGGGGFKNFEHKTSKIRISSLKWRLIFRPKSEIRMVFPPKFRWSPKKKKKETGFTEIETDFSEIQTFFPPNNQVVSKKKMVFTEIETDFSEIQTFFPPKIRWSPKKKGSSPKWRLILRPKSLVLG